MIQSEKLIAEYILKSQSPEDHARALRIRANNHFLRNEFADALNALVRALHILDVQMDPSPTQEVADRMFEDVKNQILVIGYDELLKLPRATDPRIDLAVRLLNDAGRCLSSSGTILSKRLQRPTPTGRYQKA